MRRRATGARLVGRKSGLRRGERIKGRARGCSRRGASRRDPTRPRERATGEIGGTRKECRKGRWSGRGKSAGSCGRRPTHRGMWDAVGPAQSGIVKAPNADELEPGRRTGRAPESIRKPCAALRVGEERAHLRGTQWAETATANKKRKGCSATTGAGATAMRKFGGRQSLVAREPFSKTQWTEPTARGSLREECAGAELPE